MDFTSNSNWFSVKLLIDPRSSDTNVVVMDQAYAKSIKQVCKGLNISTKHFIHFGWCAGPIKAELEELDGYNINDLGNWNVDTRRDVYSAKLPMKAMRVMGGHPDTKGSVFLPRSSIEPSRILQQQIFPCLDEKMASIDATANLTALAFLRLLQNLWKVILQDVCVLILLGRKHIMFELPVFKTDEFKSFMNDMQHHISTAEDPVDVSMEQVLPGVHEKFSNLESQMTGHFAQLEANVHLLQSTSVT